MANRGHFLRVNEYLGPLDYLVSPNGQFFTIMDRVANLAVFEGTVESGGKGLWGYSDFAREEDDYFAIMKGDGNLCVYRGSGPNDNRGHIWCTRPYALEERKDYVLVMQDDGNLCVYKGFPSRENYVWGWMGLSDGGKSFWDRIGDAFEEIGSKIADSGRAAWEATSDTARGLAEAVEDAGGEVGEAFIAGAEATRSALETGVEVAREGLVEAGKYISQHLCSIGVGSALTAVVTTYLSAGAAVPLTAAIVPAKLAGDEAALKSSTQAIAHLLGGPVSEIPIPGFDGSRDEIESVIAFLLDKAIAQDSPADVLGPGFLIGALIYGLTEFICSGKLPGGYSVWKGAQAGIPQG
jgi:hypothetical protein